MWDREDIMRRAGAETVTVTGDQSIRLSSRDGRSVNVVAKRVGRGWVLYAGSDALNNPESTIAMAVEMANWQKVFGAAT